jgi:hypothetical protein
MLRKILKRLKPQKGLPFIADKGYDAVDIIENLLDRGLEPAIRIKETMRISIRHSLRKLSNENWKRYGKMRYRIEQLFCSIKQKIGSSFKLLREDLEQEKHLLLVLFFGTSGCLQLAYSCYFCLISCTIAILNDYGRFLEQPPTSAESVPKIKKFF